MVNNRVRDDLDGSSIFAIIQRPNMIREHMVGCYHYKHYPRQLVNMVSQPFEYLS